MNARVRTGLIIAIAGLFLIAAGVFAAIRFLNIDLPGSQEPAVPTPRPETVALIAFAANDVAEGAILKAEDVTFSEIPIEFAPRDTITNPELAIGKISKVDLYAGQMILEHNLANPTGDVYDIAYVLDETHVLMAVPAIDLMSRESIIQRGDIVSILVSIEERLVPTNPTTGETNEPEEQKPEQVSFAAFQRLDITAIVIDIIQSDDTNPVANGETSVANVGVGPRRDQVAVQAYLIALDPQDALVLKYLIDAGGIFDFVLRAPTSSGPFDLTPVTAQFIKELYGLELLP